MAGFDDTLDFNFPQAADTRSAVIPDKTPIALICGKTTWGFCGVTSPLVLQIEYHLIVHISLLLVGFSLIIGKNMLLLSNHC